MKRQMKTKIINRACADPLMKLLGISVTRRKRGFVVLKMGVRKEHLNTAGLSHGGVLCALSDAAMGCAFTTFLLKDQTGVTVEFKINFLQPVFISERLEASAKVLSHGKTLYYIECSIRNSKDQLMAKAACTCKVVG